VSALLNRFVYVSFGSLVKPAEGGDHACGGAHEMKSA